jgi:hypothetical protein
MNDNIARGPNFLYAREYVISTGGEKTWNEVLQKLTAEHAAVWRGTLLISSEYPFPAFKEMVRAWSEVTGGTSREATAKLYGFIADRSLNTVYRFFLKLSQPAFVLRNFPKLWERFFTAGTVEVPVAEKGRAVIRFTLPDVFQDWLEPACYGYSRKAIEMAGGRDVAMKPSGATMLHDGTMEAAFDLTWTE